MKKTKAEALITKKKILDTSLKVFLKKGYSSTTLDDIAKSAKLTRGAIYWHFKGKEDLFENLLERVYVHFVAEITSIFESKDKTPFEKITETANLNLLVFFDDRKFRDFIELTWLKTESNQFTNLLKGKGSTTEIFIDYLVKLTDLAKKRGEIRRDLDSGEIALNITAIIAGIFRMYFVVPKYYKSKKTSVGLMNQYLNLIKT